MIKFVIKNYSVSKLPKIIYKASPIKSKKLARKLVNLDKNISSTKLKLNNIALNPGKEVTNLIGKTIESPISSSAYIGGTIASNGVAPMSIPSAIINKTIEKPVLRKLKLDKPLKSVSNKFVNGKTGKHVEGAVNGVINIISGM